MKNNLLCITPQSKNFILCTITQKLRIFVYIANFYTELWDVKYLFIDLRILSGSDHEAVMTGRCLATNEEGERHSAIFLEKRGSFCRSRHNKTQKWWVFTEYLDTFIVLCLQWYSSVLNCIFIETYSPLDIEIWTVDCDFSVTWNILTESKTYWSLQNVFALDISHFHSWNSKLIRA